MAISTEKTQLCVSDVEIFIGSHRVAYAKECNIKTIRKSRIISSYGESGSSAVAIGDSHYVLTLSRVEMATDNIGFENLGKFTLTVKKQGKLHTFLNCKWTEICEHIENKKAVLQTAVIVSPTRCITEDE